MSGPWAAVHHLLTWFLHGQIPAAPDWMSDSSAKGAVKLFFFYVSEQPEPTEVGDLSLKQRSECTETRYIH